uniref:BppU family phage baseplate upper protein n=1 Tax=Clostridium saudiense TaxID=1414720 RepID=UPI00266F1315
MNTKIIKFDINKNLYNTLIAKQGDTKSRFLLFNLLDGSIPFNLENRSVRVYAVKPDRTEVFNDLIITDAAKGYCILELTTQMLAVAGTVKLELMVIEEDKKLTSNIFYMDVKESINSEKAVVSTNEFGALLTALQDVDNWNKEFTEKSGKLEELYTPRLNELGEQLETNINYGILSKSTFDGITKK